MHGQYLSVIARQCALPDNAKMDVFETRRRRLHQILADDFKGNQAALAAKLERQPDYISRILKEPGAKNHKTIGEKFARHIEQKCGGDKPPGWLSRPDDDTGASALEELHADQIQLAGIWRRLNAMGRMKLMGFAMGLDQGSSTTQVTTLPITLTLPKSARGTGSAR